jgi:DNA repair exonuclease SbcCD nuclease subunit
MKIAVFADGHLTNSLPHTPIGDYWRRDQLIKYIDYFFKIITEEDVKYLIVPGDLAHSPILSPDDLYLIFYFFLKINENEIKTIFSIGNHDVDEGDSVLKFLNHVANPIFPRLSSPFYYADLSLSYSVDFKSGPRGTFDVINYCSHQDFLNEARDFKHHNLKKEKAILIGHVGVKGSLHGTTKSIVGVKKEDIEEIEKNYSLIILGHHHTFQQVTEKCFYIGSVHQTRIDEIDSVPGGAIIDLKNNKITKIENPFSPRFLVIKDYEFKEKEVENSIVKLVLDIETVSEEDNTRFLFSVLDCRPYYLIKPRIKKSFSIEKGVSEYSSSNKLDSIIKTINSFNLEKRDKKEFRDNTINIWNKVIGG